MRVLSLGGGVQSTTLVLMAIKGEIEMPDYVIFSDPGNESRATYEHMGWLESIMAGSGVDYRSVTIGNIYDDILSAIRDKDISRVAQPPFFTKGGTMVEIHSGQLRRKCTSEYKLIPIDREIRSILGLKKGQRFPRGFVCTKILGISLDEVQRMKPGRGEWEKIEYPLIDMSMTRWDCFNWLNRNNYPIPPKSACIICPFHDNAFWRDIKNNTPDEFEMACRLDDELRSGGGLPGVSDDIYIHRSGVPLRDIDFRNDIDMGQGELFKAECEGYCGI